MRIGIEAQRIFRVKKGGMDVVAIELIRHLQKIDKENEYIIYTRRGDETTCVVNETDNFKIKYLNGLSYIGWEQWSLPRAAEKDRVDLLHCTSNTAPLCGKMPKIITIHDIIYLEDNPWPANSNLYQKLGNLYRKLIVPHVVEKADKIITVSDFEKKNLKQKLHLDGKKLDVVYNGVNPSFTNIKDKVILEDVRKKYGFPEQFILYLGNTEPRKNIRNLLRSYAILLEKEVNCPKLVITGIRKEFLFRILNEIQCQTLVDKIILPGYVDCQDLPVIYNLSSFFIYPSFREGFGLPILESMACGTAVITSNVSSMPEIAGKAALLVDPFSPEDMAQAMRKYLSDEALKQYMIKAGNERFKEYTWENSAKKLLKIYKQVGEKQISLAYPDLYAAGKADVFRRDKAKQSSL
ncbi:MAG: glycosyltransferase family 4 protein [Cytophagaceae bacterium]